MWLETDSALKLSIQKEINSPVDHTAHFFPSPFILFFSFFISSPQCLGHGNLSLSTIKGTFQWNGWPMKPNHFPSFCICPCWAPIQISDSALGWFPAKNLLIGKHWRMIQTLLKSPSGQSEMFIPYTPKKITLSLPIRQFCSLKSLDTSSASPYIIPTCSQLPLIASFH